MQSAEHSASDFAVRSSVGDASHARARASTHACYTQWVLVNVCVFCAERDSALVTDELYCDRIHHTVRERAASHRVIVGKDRYRERERDEIAR